MSYTMNFSTADDRAAYMADFTRLPVKGQPHFVGYRVADDGQRVRIFARQHLADPLAFTFTER